MCMNNNAYTIVKDAIESDCNSAFCSHMSLKIPHYSLLIFVSFFTVKTRPMVLQL